MVKIKKKEPMKKRLTRKEQRKQKQEVKKTHKRLYHAGKTNGAQRVADAEAAAAAAQSSKGGRKKKKKKAKVNPEEIPLEQLLSGEVDDDDDESIASDFSDAEVDALLPASRKVETYEPLSKQPKAQRGAIQRQDEVEMRKRELRQQKELQGKARKQRVKQLKVDNEEEDREIAKLEKKLKLNKSKDKNRLVRKMFNDGLDYLLDFCLDDDEEKQKWEEKQERKRQMREQQEKEEAGMWSDEEEEEEDEDEAQDMPEDDSEQSGESGMEESVEEHSEEEDEDQSEDEPQSKIKEDIYGRKRDAEGNILPDPSEQEATATGQKYIPPHQRALMAAASAGSNEKQAELLARLLKQCKGLLNRLSEANLHKIAAGIEALYMKNSRYNMNETLTKLLQEALLGPTRTQERMVQEHMVLLAYLHAQIGSEIGAHFLQTFVELFDGHLKQLASLEVEDKQLNNIVLLLCYMYIFKIYELSLLMELIGRLADNLCEKTVECLLLIFQSIGFRLRKDDPLAFKTMMQNVQSKIAAAPLELKENPRLRFMVDILNAVKNNNMNKLPQYDPELAENLRKRLKAMLKNDRYVVTLNITLEDLLRADKVGKWWIVGSAWTGNLNEMGAASKQKANQSQSSAGFADQLLELAKKQQMNTAERRNIFCIIMSAADYVDAFEKILHLSLKDQRAVAYVIIHCALNERRANPYYAHLALKFCQYNRKYQLAFQFAAWDRINDIESLSKAQIRNLASFLQQLILAAGLQLSVLKVVDFMQLERLSFYFMREIMVKLLLSSDERELQQAFERIAKNSKLQQFKQSIRLFMQHFLLQQEQLAKLKLEEVQQLLLQQRVDQLDKLLAYVDL
ncbi:nucleolar MIF4G domain-containing protein 1 homolog [Drosophila guanche]|uniref:Blast:Nucleolar MIF4G domain-containing protein 1 homolog n=1 Tax=Drosophila guanche TaxID=7266 RepID=A0A3B0KUJ8_DROGU|nr:nucleolar MIF4G domain-containing protein 1 homolog [Drosophila guanche]SPP87618.1 blast:Nucleolar MIF4G domain-containing protein 1 homolog [Drosophila guanche]